MGIFTHCITDHFAFKKSGFIVFSSKYGLLSPWLRSWENDQTGHGNRLLWIEFDKPEPTSIRRNFLMLLFLQMNGFLLPGIPVDIKPEPQWVVTFLQEYTRDPDPKDVNNGYYYSEVNRQVNLMNQAIYLDIVRQFFNESGV